MVHLIHLFANLKNLPSLVQQDVQKHIWEVKKLLELDKLHTYL